jgi:capsular exopolysaccharide synthesis family protein
MGKINDALDKREKDYHQHRVETAVLSPTVFNAPPPPKTSLSSGLESYEDILTKLHTSYPGESIKSLMFFGTTHGGGVTTTAVNFAKTLIMDAKCKVLLIDANLRTPRLQQLFNIDDGRGLSDLLIDKNTGAFEVLKIGHGYLHILPCGGNYAGPVTLFESERFAAFLNEVSTEFDYVILDSAPMPNFAEARVLCEKVDGVILVIESGKIRKQVALRAKKELEDAGARILGVVLNKRKYHIPEWLYKRL